MFGHWKYAGHGSAKEGRRRQGRGGWRRPKYNIPVNIIENETEYELRLYAPSFGKDDIKISILEDMLYISGSRTPEVEFPNFILQEYPIKSFERSFELSHKVDKSGIQAKHENGVLLLIVPKTQAAQQPAQTIEID